ncbi:MAG: alpha-N-acetylglucosaminidase [Terriglobia bacterium]
MKLLGRGICAAASTTALVEAPVLAESAPIPNDSARLHSKSPMSAPEQDRSSSSARAVLMRLLGVRANEFNLDWIASENGHQVYEVSASQGTISIKGSSGVALSRGAYMYLREACDAMVTWSGRHLVLPRRLPDYAHRRVVCPYQFTHYFNVVTFGYSTPFWDWERWERELDWMALHGVTMSYAMTGQEAIWHRVWKSLGVAEAELDRFSTGPAQLPWHRMGNINRFDGPLPEGWMGQMMELQKLILDRMRCLGITPIVPAFSGYVPEALKRIYPGDDIHTLLWALKNLPSIPRNTRTFLLSPNQAELYKEIGRRFIQEYKGEFGPAEFYLADLFNEMEPPVSADHPLEDLARYARTVYEGILAGDPDGKWVMQGWLFVQDPKFWDKEAVQAFLSGIPDDRMIIIDFAGDFEYEIQHPVWKATDAYFGKQWMNGMTQTFGGDNNVKGNLPFITVETAEVLNSAEKGNLVGWAICPEGIENNEVVYELMTDVGWSERKIDLQTWIPTYCRARYGEYPPKMKEAWDLLLQSAYSSGAYTSHHSWQARPNLQPSAVHVNSGPVFQQAVERFLACADELKASELYRNDLIELVAQSAGGSVDRHLAEACKAQKAGQAKTRDRMWNESRDMLLRIDGLLNLRPDRRLQTWTDAARRWAISPDEVAYYDSNSRQILTFWGWIEINDYAARVWAGLIRDYYVGRWRAFFQALQENRTPSLDIWEQNWMSTPYVPSPPRFVRDLVVEARQMLDACNGWQ